MGLFQFASTAMVLQFRIDRSSTHGTVVLVRGVFIIIALVN
jgi:hypothetical protein